MWLGSPGFADELIRGEAFEGVEASGEVIGVDEVAQMRSQLIVGFVEVAFDARSRFERTETEEQACGSLDWIRLVAFF